MVKAVKVETLKEKYEGWLNEMGAPRKVKDLIGRTPTYEEFVNFKYGTWLRQNDPATFEAGFIEWARDYEIRTKKKVVNLTPHEIVLMPEGPDGPTVTIPPSGRVARCDTLQTQLGTVIVDGVSVPVNQTQFGAVDDLPDPQPGVIYVVSELVAHAMPWRDDIFIVDDTVRDEQGRIIGARALARVWEFSGESP